MLIKGLRNPGISPISKMSKFNDLSLVEQKLIFSFLGSELPWFIFYLDCIVILIHPHLKQLQKS